MTETRLLESSYAIFGAIVLLWRLYQWDEAGRAVSIVEHSRYVNDDRRTSQIRPTTVDEANHRWRVGKLAFGESEWRRCVCFVLYLQKHVYT